ncbi:hypothetical protein ppKF707_3208 [Metapseudomonas furukawaii]|uniref:Uncharacterized protein n=1 Tax=Metapseudomonas furukawaii TaxID=1149133 RepID=A0AAD1FD31_METFU|nr:hypothetical protein ppKF707_3208 [Pseudomonas furukawaii]BAU72040.1 hypothetical protein KF707C_3520 [Pseudomonas furukawaii]
MKADAKGRKTDPRLRPATNGFRRPKAWNQVRRTAASRSTARSIFFVV